MCCCQTNCNNRSSCGCGCNCGCNCGNNSGITTLPSFPDLTVFPGTTVTNTQWPVYVSVPAFLWDTSAGDSPCGCRG